MCQKDKNTSGGLRLQALAAYLGLDLNGLCFGGNVMNTETGLKALHPVTSGNAAFSPRALGYPWQHLQDTVLVSSSDEELAPEGRQASTNSCHPDSSVAVNLVTSSS